MQKVPGKEGESYETSSRVRTVAPRARDGIGEAVVYEECRGRRSSLS